MKTKSNEYIRWVRPDQFSHQHARERFAGRRQIELGLVGDGHSPLYVGRAVSPRQLHSLITHHG